MTYCNLMKRYEKVLVGKSGFIGYAHIGSRDYVKDYVINKDGRIFIRSILCFG